MEHILPFAASLDLLPPGGRVLCALSGGGDSVALVHFLKTHGFPVAAAHFDHHLRPTSGRDRALCEALCRELDVPLYVGEGEIGALPGNTEENARNARYDFLRRTAEEAGAAVVATAHTASDNLETVLMHLTRGCGLQGLTGISPWRQLGAVELVRPMLHTTRQGVEEYLARHRLPYATDETNLDERYTRNRLRHRVVPVLEELNPRVAEACARMTDRLRADAARLGPWTPPEAPRAPVWTAQRVRVGETCVTPLWTLETREARAPDGPPTPDRFYLRREAVGETLLVRPRQTGDRLHPPYRTGKTVKKWLNELGVPPHLREAYPVAESGGAVLTGAGIGPQGALLARPGEAAVAFVWTHTP